MLAYSLLVLLSLFSFSQGQTPVPIPRACMGEFAKLPYCNPKLPMEERIAWIVRNLTVAEKGRLLIARQSPGNNISRLGIPEYDWGANCIHGVQSSCLGDRCATSFPSPNGLGASFDVATWLTMGTVIGTEIRAFWLAGGTEANHASLHVGLDCWSPNVGIQRDPRWGRNQECPGEDAVITGTFGAAYSLAMQNNPAERRFQQGIATLKHYAVNQLEGHWNPDGSYGAHGGRDGPITRHSVSAKVTQFDLFDSYLPAFELSIRAGGAAGVMCSYNAVNGVPSCANKYLLGLLKDRFNYSGYITSDSGAVVDIFDPHHYTKTPCEAAAAAMNAGTDIQSNTGDKLYISCLPDLLSSGAVSEATLDGLVAQQFRTRFQLGLFDPIDDQPLWHIPVTTIQSPRHVAQAKAASRKVLVLLRNYVANGKPYLPLTPSSFSSSNYVAVLGPHGNATSLTGNYIGQLCPHDQGDQCITTPLAAVQAVVGAANVKFEQGSGMSTSINGGIAAATAIASKAGAVIMYVGIDQTIESEGHDRDDLRIPEAQRDLIDAVLKVATGKVTIILINGGALALDQPSSLVESSSAIIESFYPGIYGAEAIADAIFGSFSPDGRMPITLYPSSFTAKANVLDWSLTTAPGRTYKYYKGEQPVFPFGHGLTYTTFAYKSEASPDSITIAVTNVGNFTASCILLAFWAPQETDIPADSQAASIQSALFEFGRTAPLQPGSSARLTFGFDDGAVMTHDDKGVPTSYSGMYRIVVTEGDGNTPVATVPFVVAKTTTYNPDSDTPIVLRAKARLAAAMNARE